MAKENEIKTLQYPAGDVVCWSPAYAKRELQPDDPNAPAIVLGLFQCQMTPPDPEYDAVSNMTGRYEGDESLCCVNQAGYHMEIWFSMRKGARKVSRYGADYNPLAAGERVIFEIRESGDATAFLDPATPGLTRSDPVGLLTIVGLFSFELQWSDGTMSMFRRFSPRATLSDQVIERLRDEKFGHGNPIIDGWLANEHAPVSEKDAKRLEDVIIHDRVDEKEPSFRQLLRDLFAIEPERQAEIHIAILAIIHVVGVDAALPFASKLVKAGKYGRYLAKKGVSKVLDKIQEFRWDWGTTLKKYRKQIESKLVDKIGGALAEIIEAHAGGKVLFGVLLVRSPDGSWEAEYDVVAAIGAVGMGGTQLGEEPMTVKGWSESAVDWKPSNFEGNFAVLPGLMATDAHGKRAEKQMIWLLDGGGTTGEMQLVFDEVETDASDMDLGWGYGRILELDKEDVHHTTFARRPIFEYTTEYKQQDAIQFQLGSATLRWSGRQMLRVFAANELALLRDPTSRVDVEGFADRIGQRWYNKQLSEARAANIRQALVDCLGGDLNATVETQGHGEDVLAAIGEAFFPDEKGSEQWRRGFVVMNAQVAATLGTNDPTVRRKKK